MKRDFSTVLMGLGDIAFQDDKGQPLTLGALSSGVLGTKYQGDQDLSGDEQYKRYLLAERIFAGGQQEVTAEEVTLIKRQIAKACEPRLLGPAYQALELDPMPAEQAPA